MKKVAKNPRILVATGLYSPEIGGPATYTKILEETLPNRNISIVVAPFRRIRFLPRIIRHLAYFFYILAKSFNVEVIYALDPVSVGLPSAMVARMLNKRFLVRIAGDYAWEQGVIRHGITDSLDDFSKQTNGYPKFVLLLKRIQKFVTSDADLVIVPSLYLKKIVKNWGVEEKHVHVIYNAFHAPTGLAAREVLRQMMHLKNDVIITAGRLVPWKGFETLISAMPEVVKSRPGAKLFIAGSGSDEEKLQELISSKKLDESVVLVGQLDKTTLHNYIKAADVFILNTFYEGLSHQLLECMAIGTPIITTPVGGNVEVIEDKKTGYFVEYNNQKEIEKALISVLENKAGAEKVVNNARKKVNEFSQDKMIEELTSILK